MANQLDDAFNWLVVILGIIAGALTQFPQLAVFGWYLLPEQASQVVPLNVSARFGYSTAVHTLVDTEAGSISGIHSARA